MPWTRDGSGLLVKRIRGKTLPQWVLDGLVRIDHSDKRHVRRMHWSSATSNADMARGRWQERKEAHRGLGS